MKNRLREIRQRRQLSQTDLARELGITRQTIYGIEKGNFIPSTMIALKLAKKFNVAVEEIFFLE